MVQKMVRYGPSCLKYSRSYERQNVFINFTFLLPYIPLMHTKVSKRSRKIGKLTNGSNLENNIFFQSFFTEKEIFP
jgi:hypothetical protein